MSNKYTSRTLKGIAWLWVFFPLVYMSYCGLALSVPLAGLVRISLTPGFWFVSLVSMAAGFGVLQIRWYGWYIFLAANVMTSYLTAVVLANHSGSTFKLLLFSFTALFQSLLVYLVAREVRVPYFFPKIRWWESDPRYKLSLQTKILRSDNSEHEGLIMDLSLGGCFIKTHAFFQSDEVVNLRFELFERTLECSGQVVWMSESTVTHPKGIGIKFEPLNRETAFVLRKGVRKMRRLARAYTQLTRERNWREYLQRERRYQERVKK